ncbi:MAG: CHASE2 domain-containing protein [Caulobacteraceae bacterium]
MISPTRILKALLVSLLLAASAWGVSKLNLFGLESASDRLADGVFQRITAASYGKDLKGQRKVSIVYLDETSIENMKGYGWGRFPPTFDQQWTMLDDVLNAAGTPPAAVFVDFVYMGQGGPADGFQTFRDGVAAATRAAAWKDKPGCTVTPLMKLSCITAAGGVPMVFAKPSPDDLPLFTEVQKSLDEVAVMAPAIVRNDAYPVITSYQMPPAEKARLGVHGFDISPAFSLYVANCLRAANTCGDASIAALKAAGQGALAGQPAISPDLSKTYEAPLDVVWGSRPDPAYISMTKAVSGEAPDCRGQASGWWGRFAEQFAGWRAPTGKMQECPYTLNLGYDRLVAGHGLQMSDLQRLLAGKLVLVGGHFRASNDWVDSPVHGQLPGVHYHAMALDNLMEDGVEYRRNGGSGAGLFDSDMLKSLLIFALAFCGVLGVMTRNSLLDRAIETGIEPRLRSHLYGPLYLLLFTTSIGVIFAATWLGVSYAHRSPINWIGIGFVALGFLFYATRQTLPEDICGSLEKVPVVRRLLAWSRLCMRSLKFEEERLVLPKKPAAKPVKSPDPIPVSTPQEGTVHVQA